MRIFYNDTRAIVAHEESKVFYHTTLEQARKVAQGNKHTSTRQNMLMFTAESLLGSGWREESE